MNAKQFAGVLKDILDEYRAEAPKESVLHFITWIKPEDGELAFFCFGDTFGVVWICAHVLPRLLKKRWEHCPFFKVLRSGTFQVGKMGEFQKFWRGSKGGKFSVVVGNVCSGVYCRHCLTLLLAVYLV